MAIKVCDVIMGGGKSQSAITYMNEHPDEKYIYIAPYLDEDSRINSSCPNLSFVEPDNSFVHHLSKIKHTAELIKRGRNIASTHQAFKMYTEEMLDDIKRQEYTLIIDESINLVETCDISKADVDMMIHDGYLKYDDDGELIHGDREYPGGSFDEFFWTLKNKRLSYAVQQTARSGKVHMYYWMWSPTFLTSFKDVFILTYLFHGQGMRYFFDISDLNYQYIGVEKTVEDGMDIYRFSDEPKYIPEYVAHIRDMIDVVESEKVNGIGDSEYALSENWFKRSQTGSIEVRESRAADIGQLKNNTYNVFRNMWSDSDAEHRMWSVFKPFISKVVGKGYTKGFVALNQSATNNYRHKTFLCYNLNIFMNVGDKIFYQRHGIEVDEDAYALSIMIQWIWRSAIRDGQKIHLYLPSSRMRRILYDWMDSLERGGAAH